MDAKNSIDILTDEFINLMRSRYYSNHTLRNYKLDLELFFSFCTEKKISSINGINKELTLDYLSFLSTKSYKRTTYARKVSTLRMFFKYLHETRNHQELSYLLEAPKRSIKLRDVLCEQQVQDLIYAPNRNELSGLRDSVIFELLYSSGLRVEELVSLNVFDIQQTGLRILGKGRKVRVVPISIKSFESVMTYIHKSQSIRKDGAVFLNKFGGRITTRSVQRMFKKYAIQISIPFEITPHVIRHSIATHLLERGMPIKHVQSFLGHSNLQTTTVYTKVSGRLKQDAVKKFHPVNDD
jgi:integrase/recombinase XerC